MDTGSRKVNMLAENLKSKKKKEGRGGEETWKMEEESTLCRKGLLYLVSNFYPLLNQILFLPVGELNPRSNSCDCIMKLFPKRSLHMAFIALSLSRQHEGQITLKK